MYQYSGIVTDNGAVPIPLAGALVSVLDGAGNLASLLDDEGNSLPNPLESGPTGAYQYFVSSEGQYTHQYRYGGRLRSTEQVVVGTLIAAVNPSPSNGGKFIAYDASGNPTASAGTGADSGLRTDLAVATGAALVKASDGNTVQANLDHGGFFTQTGGATRTTQAKNAEIVSITDFSGTTVAQFKAAAALLTARGGGVLNVPRGSYSLDSAELSAAIGLTDNVMVEGNGSTLTITGTSTIAQVFAALNASNVTIRNLNAIGNNKGVADASSGAFFKYWQDASGSGIENVRVENVRVQNFQTERCVQILNVSTTGQTIRGVFVRNLSGISQSGNNLGPTSIGVGADLLTLYGVEENGLGTNPKATIYDVYIENVYAEADYIKCGIHIFHAIDGVKIVKPRILNAGSDSNDDVGAYAINCYGNPGELNNITIDDPVITNPRSCGIYLRGCLNVSVNSPVISGQSDTSADTLPKGAIALDGSAFVTVNGGNLTGNAYDVMAAANTASTDFSVLLNGVVSSGSSNTSIFVNPTSGSGSPDGFTIANCTISSAGRAVYVDNNRASSGRSLAHLNISNSRLTALSGNGVTLNPNGSAALTGYRITNTRIAATSQGIEADSTATGDLTITGTTIEDAGSSALTYGIIARAFPELHLTDVTIRGMGAGYATLTDGANGTIDNLKLHNVTNGCSPSSLGMIAPTLAGTQGWFVQDLNPVEAGTAGSKYVRHGWRYAGSWLPQRSLTGN